MGTLLFILLVAVVNLCLGFCTAQSLRHAQTWPWRLRGRVAEQSANANAEANRVENASAETPTPEEASDPAERDPDLAALSAASDEEVEDARPKGAIEQAIVTLQAAGTQHRQALAAVDGKVRAALKQGDNDALESCTTELIEQNRRLFPAHTTATEILQQQENVPKALTSVAQQAVRESEAQLDVLREAVNELDGLAKQSFAAEDSGSTILDAMAKMIESSHTMRDSLEDAILEIARREERVAELSDRETTDPATRLTNLSGLEQRLARWWQEDPQSQRPLSIGLLDLDHCRDLNREHGSTVIDKVLEKLAELTDAQTPPESSTYQLPGRQLALLLPDCPLDETTTHVERLRQMVEQSPIQHAGQSFQVTISCAVAQAIGGDTVERLLDRTSGTLKEAKRYGRNRTFIYENNYPTPVVPPDLAVSGAGMHV